MGGFFLLLIDIKIKNDISEISRDNCKTGSQVIIMLLLLLLLCVNHNAWLFFVEGHARKLQMN